MGEGREGDWECGGCRNRNYAFRSICNRCKHPRLLVDIKTSADSKWLPRIGDWICTGCSNNNYASREKCKKCGQPKEDAAIPVVAMPGASLQTYAHYFARVQGLPGLKMNLGISGGSALQQTLLPSSNWLFGGSDKYRIQSTPNWPFSSVSSSSGFLYAGNTNQLPAFPNDWRNGDWMCSCGFHNYSSRTQCKKCDAPLPSAASSAAVNSAASDNIPTLRTKRLASEEFVHDWDNKRLNAGDINRHFLTGQQHMYRDFEQLARSSNDQITGMYSKYPSGNSATVPSSQGNMQSPQQAIMPVLLGKGAKQWRDGDWMCSNCNNHNFASRSYCNRCKTQKEAVAQPVSDP